MALEPGACLLWAFLLLTLPLRWLLGAAIAAAVHEAWHIGALLLLGRSPGRITLGALGIRMEVDCLSWGQEALCAGAGPAGSLSLLMLGRVFPELAACALLQGAFNLLPVYPLDGGRVLRCLCLGLLGDPAGEGVFRWVQGIFLGIICLGAVRLGLWQLCALAAVVIAVGKIPCKRRQLGVQ